MSRTVDIEIFNIAKTAICPNEATSWLKHLGASRNYQDDIYVQGMDEASITNPALLIALAAKRCYMSFEAGLNPNVTKVRSEFVEYIDNILKSGHGSVLEHSSYTFAIEGVSRVFTGEMNRHRAGVGISEGSMRFIRFTDIPYWLPTSIQVAPEMAELYRQVQTFNPEGIHTGKGSDYAMTDKRLKSQEVFKEVFGAAERGYKKLLEIWKDELEPTSPFKDKKHVTSMMRRIVPMGVATGGVWTMNMRSVRHVMAMRASEAAEEEILHVFSRIVMMMVESEPMLCGDFKQNAHGFWAPKYPKV